MRYFTFRFHFYFEKRRKFHKIMKPNYTNNKRIKANLSSKRKDRMQLKILCFPRKSSKINKIRDENKKLFSVPFNEHKIQSVCCQWVNYGIILNDCWSQLIFCCCHRAPETFCLPVFCHFNYKVNKYGGKYEKRNFKLKIDFFTGNIVIKGRKWGEGWNESVWYDVVDAFLCFPYNDWLLFLIVSLSFCCFEVKFLFFSLSTFWYGCCVG